ncbi:MAG: ribonuclease Y [Lachnospiraceae bacterium]|nr:ribonuclease Y [Lachnospiraceae bacterium]
MPEAFFPILVAAQGGALVPVLIAVFVTAIVTAIVAIVVSLKIIIPLRMKEYEAEVGSAEQRSKEIIDDANRSAQKIAATAKKEALLEAKEEALRAKNESDREIKERRAEVQRYEKRVTQKEENLDRKLESLEKKEARMNQKEQDLDRKLEEANEYCEKQIAELERISGLTSDKAKEYLLESVKEDVKHETAVMIRELESEAKETADKRAKELIVNSIQKCAADHVAEATISVVQLPNDEMKGRIIGREGRNIRTIETLTGIDLIIDDTPEAVILSGFDPIRREIARIALEKLVVDGRIHPARIEEMVDKAQREVENIIREEGEAAVIKTGVHGLHPEMVRLLGKMKYRTSYGQNALKHSIEVSLLSGLLAGELGADVRLAKRAGLLHDIGKSVDHEMEGTHVQIGIDICKKYKESPVVINAVASHHGDCEPTSIISFIVQAADTISAARPGARRETLDTYTNRLNQLEDIANSFKGVEKSFAIQAGREVRVMVVPEQVSDDDMVLIARELSKKIESELEYPGQIKISMIRESRVTDYAK